MFTIEKRFDLCFLAPTMPQSHGLVTLNFEKITNRSEKIKFCLSYQKGNCSLDDPGTLAQP